MWYCVWGGWYIFCRYSNECSGSSHPLLVQSSHVHAAVEHPHVLAALWVVHEAERQHAEDGVGLHVVDVKPPLLVVQELRVVLPSS